MSHFTVLVHLTRDRAARHNGNIEEALNEILAPYDEQTKDERFLVFEEDEDSDVDEKTGKRGYWRNPNRKWDWWVVGGRWTGFFPVKPGVEPRLGNRSFFGEGATPGTADIVLKSELDLDTVASKGREAAEKWFADYEAWTTAPSHDWRSPRDHALTLGLLRVVQGPATAGESEVLLPWSTIPHLKEGDERRAWHDVIRKISREDFIAGFATAFDPIKTYAVLNDAGWHAPGRMGWFGMSDDTPDAYLAFARDYLANFIRPAADDDTLVVVDCHI